MSSHHLLSSSQKRRPSVRLCRSTIRTAIRAVSGIHLGNTIRSVINALRLFAHGYPPLFIARYSFMQLNDLEQRRLNARFEIAGQDSNPGFLKLKFRCSRHCASHHRATAPPRHRATAPPRHRATASPRHCATAPPRHRATV